jgi:hypothetical protein
VVLGKPSLNEHDFESKLAWSKGQARATDAETIKALIPGCVTVEAATEELDRKGIDYVATLRRGATVNIDIKAREIGVSRYWKATGAPLFGNATAKEPELTLEQWSVMPEKYRPGKAGWTLDESKLTDYVLYLFDPADTTEVFLLPFQLLRAAFRRNVEAWRMNFRVGVCTSNGGAWSTESVFVPAWCVIDAIASEMRATIGCAKRDS